MASRKKIRSQIVAALPHAEGNLIDLLASEVEQELGYNWGQKPGKQNDPDALIEQIIKQEELAELGLKK